MDVAETAKGIRQRASEISNAARVNAKPYRIISSEYKKRQERTCLFLYSFRNDKRIKTYNDLRLLVRAGKQSKFQLWKALM